MFFEFLDEHIFDALVLNKVSSVIFFGADLTLDHDFRTIIFNVLKQLGSGHVLEILMIADITSEFWAGVGGMVL